MDSGRVSRRRFITSAALTVSLPWLPSLRHSRRARAAECAPAKRFIAYMFPNGHHMPEHVPTGTGSGTAWALPPMLEALSDLKSELLFVSGLENQHRRRENGDHAIGCGALLTARKPEKDRPHTNMSVDQAIADAQQSCRGLHSLQLGTQNAGPHDQFGTYYTRSISFRGLTLGALLTSTSFSARTSPVKRGDFVFTHLLCGTIPPPPADVPALAEDMDSLTLRERLEEHRKNPACAACHKVMDPLGFGLENYDAVGAYRTRDGDAPINATGTLPDGSSFDGALELSAILADDERFPRCVTRKFMTFASGRLLDQPEDERWVDYLTAQAQLGDGSLADIIKTVLLSEVFLSRKPSQ